MSNFEKKFGKYAIPNLTLILIGCYVAGYLIQIVSPGLIGYLSLDAAAVLHGQVWRLVTWLVIPPESFSIFTLIMLYFYYSIGTLMERTLGTYRYNVYLLGGMLMTIVASFLCVAVLYLFPSAMGPEFAESYQSFLQVFGDKEAAASAYVQVISRTYSLMFSTYYINISIFLAFAVCYPNMQVLLMFVIPVKVKWMGILDLILLVYEMIAGNLFSRFAVGAALLNFLVFYLTTKNMGHLRPSQIKRRAQFRQQVRQSAKITKHKCAICGRTEESDPDMEFRFCSKCNGNYEYCSVHLYTHEHVK